MIYSNPTQAPNSLEQHTRSAAHRYKSNNWLKRRHLPMRRKPFKKENPFEIDVFDEFGRFGVMFTNQSAHAFHDTMLMQYAIDKTQKENRGLKQFSKLGLEILNRDMTDER